MDPLQTRLDALEPQMHAVNRRLRWWQGLAREDAAEKDNDPKGRAQRVPALEQLLKHVSREGKAICITGCLGVTAAGAVIRP